MRAVVVASMIFAGGLVAVRPACADLQRIAPDGSVHRVEVEVTGTAKATGTALRWTKQRPQGGKDTGYIPGTEDTTIDRDPAVEIEPGTGRPIVVWSRFDGTGFNLFYSRYDGTAWCPARALYRGDGDDYEPQIRFGATSLHVSWRQEISGISTWYRSSYLAATLDPIYGPERIADDGWPVGPDGDAGTGLPAPPRWDKFFCATVFSKVVGEPGRAIVWGVRDEPVPISYRQVFILPCEVKSSSQPEAAWIGGKFTVWFVSGDRLYYTTRGNAGWAPMRVVEMPPGSTSGDAHWLVYLSNLATPS